MDEELEKIRKRIDEVDEKIVKLLEERLSLANEAGALKKKKKLPVSDPAREKKVLENALKRKKSLDDKFLSSLFRSIIDYCKNEESK